MKQQENSPLITVWIDGCGYSVYDIGTPVAMQYSEDSKLLREITACYISKEGEVYYKIDNTILYTHKEIEKMVLFFIPYKK